jgi:hypothetical protein
VRRKDAEGVEWMRERMRGLRALEEEARAQGRETEANEYMREYQDLWESLGRWRWKRPKTPS